MEENDDKYCKLLKEIEEVMNDPRASIKIKRKLLGLVLDDISENSEVFRGGAKKHGNADGILRIFFHNKSRREDVRYAAETMLKVFRGNDVAMAEHYGVPLEIFNQYMINLGVNKDAEKSRRKKFEILFEYEGKRKTMHYQDNCACGSNIK
ncbi:MAG: hypothetical protein Q8L29_03905 [archaeon]|nr:hypothetical protein [archaeon]